MDRLITYSKTAVQDLDEIYDYIKFELKNPSAASDTIDGILDKIEYLALFPRSGSVLEFENGLNTGYRYVRYKNYIVFYRLTSNDDVAVIDRILYAGRDYMNILFDNDS